MKIWDKIKEHFFKLFHEEIKQLPESTVEKVSENSGEIWRENLKIEKNQLTKQINEPNQSQLDKAIFQYMDAYYDEWKNAKDLCNKLIILKQNYPRLFSGSEYTNPFVKKDEHLIEIEKI